MKTLELLKQKVEKAAAVAKDKLPVADSVAKIGQDAASLAKRISEDKYVKIPFVGDFNSGKSSLLNSFLGRDILPTNILPETAVAYEIYFSENERLELVADGNVKKTSSSLDDIKTFSVTPSDIVRVYVNNADVKSLNDKGVVLVDMPGIDSGIEAHNNAILNYIKEGTVFMLFNDAENGTLRSSTVSFINEIKQYGLSVHLFVSKADKKPADEIAQIKAQFEQTAKALIKADAQVGVTSAVDSSYGFKDVLAVLQQIDGGRILEEKYQTEVNAFVDSIVSQFELQIKLTLSDKKDFDEMLDKLSDKKREAVAQLEAKSASAQPIDGSVDDIITDVRQALMRNSQRLAVLARESETQLRTLLQDRTVQEPVDSPTVDLAAALDKFSSASVTVSTMAGQVWMERRMVDEVEATLSEALKNVEKHAGPDAEAWVLLDQETDDEVILFVRDNGVGMTAESVSEAARRGRMGIQDSIVGRMAAIGGSAMLTSTQGSGTEWELRFPLEGDNG